MPTTEREESLILEEIIRLTNLRWPLVVEKKKTNGDDDDSPPRKVQKKICEDENVLTPKDAVGTRSILDFFK